MLTAVLARMAPVMTWLRSLASASTSKAHFFTADFDFTTAAAVRVTEDGERIVTDGPFAESREVLGGYFVLDVPDFDVALDWAARCPGARDGGSIVVRPLAEFAG